MVVPSGKHALADKPYTRSEREQRHAGQVKHDERGNAVWQWAADTARAASESTSQLLRRLDVSSLSLDEKPPATDTRPDQDVRGFDPYSSNAGGARHRSQPAAATPAATPASAGSKHRRSWWQRLLRRD
jgi:hypothetical protein